MEANIFLMWGAGQTVDSKERFFSNIGLILSVLRFNVEEDILQDIMKCLIENSKKAQNRMTDI
jgi:hypothetical protein